MILLRTATRQLMILTVFLSLNACSDNNNDSNNTAVIGQSVTADFHTGTTPPLDAGQFELHTVSTFPDTVTGGDVLLAIRGLTADDDEFTVTRNGADVTDVFHRLESGEIHGLITGLDEGINTLAATANGQTATLEVKNHPMTGPVASGPQQQPFRCRTDEAGLGEPIDEHCSIETQVEWYYRSQTDNQFHLLDDPYAPYPADTMFTSTDDGLNVPYVVRLESLTVNRGIGRIAVLDDPAARGPDESFDARHWNHRIHYFFGSSSGVGYHQGSSNPALVLGTGYDTEAGVEANVVGVSDRLSKGDAVVHNTLTVFGNIANPLVNAETAGMMKEYIIENYGLVDTMIGAGVSGGSIQQRAFLNSAPGLLTGSMVSFSFTDVVTTAMTVTDCGLLLNYFNNSALDWNQQKRAAVQGHNLQTTTDENNICQNWVDSFLPLLTPTENCVPEEQRYHPENNPGGTRCSIQDSLVNIVGRDPETGFARRPLDNVGVQYGLQALLDGTISSDEFIDLNRNIGGFDIDANFVAERHAMDPELAGILFKLGAVFGTGVPDETPMMDMGLYLDMVPTSVGNIHESVRPFVARERFSKYTGQIDTMPIWRGVVTIADALPVMNEWIAARKIALEAGATDHRQATVASKPESAADKCVIATGGGRLEIPDRVMAGLGIAEFPLLPTVAPLADAFPDFDVDVPLRIEAPEDFSSIENTGLCNTVLPPVRTPRIAAGMPIVDDVIKCQLKPIDPADYAGTLGDAQLAELNMIFPEGVCDYSAPSVGALAPGEKSLIWPNLGSTTLEPVTELKWRVARSK